jgi:hypothetical protein
MRVSRSADLHKWRVSERRQMFAAYMIWVSRVINGLMRNV